jgi:CD2 antigen cytoplasmic tail-binding protein 2
MNEDDVEGQEDKTVDFDDGERITPFNMKEEMEEGHFDKQGNYFLKKDNDIKVMVPKSLKN